jgi:hypothetical protein
VTARHCKRLDFARAKNSRGETNDHRFRGLTGFQRALHLFVLIP